MDIQEAIKSTDTMQEAAALLQMPFTTFKRKAKDLGLYDPTPFEDRRKALGHIPTAKVDLSVILAGLHPGYNTNRLKLRCIAEGILENKCSACGLTGEWNGKPIALQLDHKNGQSRDHRLENLRILCPNCHSQTETFGGRNIRSISEL